MASLDQFRAEFQAALATATTPGALRAVRDQYLSRKHGHVTALLKAVGAAPPEARRALGAEANALRIEIESALEAREAEIASQGPAPGAIDITLPGRVPLVG